MSWTRKQLIDSAFEELGLAPYVYDITPEQYQSASRRMDGMMAGFEANGIRINYAFAANPDTADINSDSGVPEFANEAIYLNLAQRLAPTYGKQLSPETTHNAQDAYGNLVNQCASPPIEMGYPTTLPRGAGNKPWRARVSPFIDNQNPFVQTGNDGKIDYNP